MAADASTVCLGCVGLVFFDATISSLAQHSTGEVGGDPARLAVVDSLGRTGSSERPRGRKAAVGKRLAARAVYVRADGGSAAVTSGGGRT